MNDFRLNIIIISIALISILFASTTVAFDSEDTSVDSKANGEMMRTGVDNINLRIYKIEGKEMIQLREIADRYNWSLAFNSEEKSIIIRGNGKIIHLSLEEKTLNKRHLSDTPVIKDGRTYLSIDNLQRLIDEIEEGLVLLTGLYTDNSNYRVDEEITAHIIAYNLSNDEINLDFSSGQRYDLAIYQGDEEVWRWSEGRFFTMALARETLKPGESLKYDLQIPIDLDPGEYILSGKLTTINSAIDLNEMKFKIVE